MPKKPKRGRTASLNAATAANGSLKRKHMSREAALEEVSRLELMGFTQRQIAERVGVSVPQVNRDLKEVRRILAERMIERREAAVRRKVAQLEVVRAEAWDAWERSKSDRRRVQSEYARPAGGKADPSKGSAATTRGFRETMVRLKAVVTREGRLPEGEYMKVIVKTLEMEAELMGLYPDDPAGGGGDGRVFDWLALAAPSGPAAGTPPAQARVDEIEGEILKAGEGGP